MGRAMAHNILVPRFDAEPVEQTCPLPANQRRHGRIDAGDIAERKIEQIGWQARRALCASAVSACAPIRLSAIIWCRIGNCLGGPVVPLVRISSNGASGPVRWAAIPSARAAPSIGPMASWSSTIPAMPSVARIVPIGAARSTSSRIATAGCSFAICWAMTAADWNG